MTTKETNYINEIINEFEEKFGYLHITDIIKPFLIEIQQKTKQETTARFLNQKTNQHDQEVRKQCKQEITKLIKTVGATGTEEEVDKLIKLIKDK